MDKVPINGSSNNRQFGDEVHRVFVDVLPVLGLVDTVRVGLSKLALGVEGSDGGAELGHGVQVGGEVVEHSDNVGREAGAVGPLGGQPLDLGVRGHITGHQQPEEAFGQGLVAPRSLRQQLLALRDRVAPEADSLVRIQHRSLCHQTFDATHAAVHLQKQLIYFLFRSLWEFLIYLNQMFC